MNYDITNQNRLSLALHYNCFTVMVKHILRFLPVTLRNLDTVTPLNHQPWPQHSVGWPHHGQILADATSLDHMLLLGQFSVFSENQTNLHVSNFIHRNFNNVKKKPTFVFNQQADSLHTVSSNPGSFIKLSRSCIGSTFNITYPILSFYEEF